MRFNEALVFVGIGVAVGLSCSGRHQSSATAQPPSAAVVGSSGLTARDEGGPDPGAPAWCSLVKGDPNASCSPSGAPVFLPDVDAAIDELVQKRPELFDLKRVVGEKGYRVLSTEPFYLGVAAILQTKGLCAGWDLSELQVKSSQTHSEQYDLMLSNGHIRRGAASYRTTCTPASFPLDPADVIERVRVGFYSIQCEGERIPPRNGEGLLPVDCTGFVTATPKKKDESDVDRRIHGPEITWELEQAGESVSIEDFPKVDFNKLLRGRDPGEFRLCATVQTHRGCLSGKVIE
jgi:hypothetical protein